MCWCLAADAHILLGFFLNFQLFWLTVSFRWGCILKMEKPHTDTHKHIGTFISVLLNNSLMLSIFHVRDYYSLPRIPSSWLSCVLTGQSCAIGLVQQLAVCVCVCVCVRVCVRIKKLSKFDVCVWQKSEDLFSMYSCTNETEEENCFLLLCVGVHVSERKWKSPVCLCIFVCVCGC